MNKFEMQNFEKLKHLITADLNKAKNLYKTLSDDKSEKSERYKDRLKHLSAKIARREGKLDTARKAFNYIKDKYNKTSWEYVNSSLEICIIDYKSGKIDEVKRRGEKLLRIAIENDFDTEAVVFRILLGLMNKNNGNLVTAYKHFNKALKYYEKTEQELEIGNMHVWISTIHSEINEYQKAIDHLLKAAECYKTEQGTGLANTYNSMGLIYLSLNDLDKAKNYFEKAMKLYKQFSNKDKIADVLNNMGLLYKNIGIKNDKKEIIEKAIDFYKRSLKFRNPHNNYMLMKSNNNLGYVYFILKKFEAADHIFTKLINILQVLDNPNYILENYELLIETSIELNDFTKAEEYYLTAQKVFQKNKSKIYASVKKSYYYSIKKYWTAKGNLQKALDAANNEIAAIKDLQSERIELERELFEEKLEVLEQMHKVKEIEKKNNELKKANEFLKKAKEEISELEKKNSVLAMGITINHEIRQPLTVINGNIDLLKITSTNLNNKQLSYIKEITNNLKRIQTIITKYKKFDRIDYIDYAGDDKMLDFKNFDLEK